MKLPFSSERVTFCEYCYECYRDNQKCDYCGQVYFSVADDSEVDGKDWISCDDCSKWNHPDCEILLGKDKRFVEAARSSKLAADQSKAEQARLDAIIRQRDVAEARGTLTEEQRAKLSEDARKCQQEIERIDSIEEAAYYCVRCRKND